MSLLQEKWLFANSSKEAERAQKEMAERVLIKDELRSPITRIAGADVSHTPFDADQKIFGAIVVLNYPALTPLATATQVDRETFPYIPGLLGFREAPVLVRAYQRLAVMPDVLLVDGHGISHPRGLGIASHLGVLLDLPTIGVAKSILVGEPAAPLAEEVGSTVSLLWKGKEIGLVVRTKKRSSPLIISSGHRVTLSTAKEIVFRCLRGYRLPEPTRHAHLAANRCRKEYDLDVALS